MDMNVYTGWIRMFIRDGYECLYRMDTNVYTGHGYECLYRMDTNVYKGWIRMFIQDGYKCLYRMHSINSLVFVLCPHSYSSCIKKKHSYQSFKFILYQYSQPSLTEIRFVLRSNISANEHKLSCKLHNWTKILFSRKKYFIFSPGIFSTNDYSYVQLIWNICSNKLIFIL